MPIKIIRVLEYTYTTYEDYMDDKQRWFVPLIGTRVPNKFTTIKATFFEPEQTPNVVGD